MLPFKLLLIKMLTRRLLQARRFSSTNIWNYYSIITEGEGFDFRAYLAEGI